MEEKDKKELVDGIVAKVSVESASIIEEKMKAAKEGLMSTAQFADGIKGLASTEEIKKLADVVEQIAVDFKKQHEGINVEKTITEMIMDQKDVLASIKGGRTDLHAKFVIPAYKTTVVTGTSWTDSRQALRIPGVNEPASRMTKIASLFSQIAIGADNGGAIRYVDQTTTTRSAAARSENVAAAESAIAFTERVLPIMNISDSIPTTRESLSNFSYLEGVLRKFINTNCDLAEEAEVYSGSGSAPHLTGAYTSATTFDTGTMITGTVPDASTFDLINYLSSYVSSGKDSKYMADYVVMNDMDVWQMLSKKDANNNYIIPPFVRIMGNDIYIGRVKVIPSNLVTTNTMLIGDFRQGEYHSNPNWEITLGYVNTDFTQNVVRMLANKQAALLIKTADITAFYKVTSVSAAVTALTA